MKKHVLMIEDFPVIQDLYKHALETAGYSVDIAVDGSIALNKLKQVDYDIILLDMLLPKMNGIEFLEAFNDRPAHTKIVVLSDFNDPERTERAKELGATAYLQKTDTPPSELIKLLDGFTASETK
jgi:CheY-like chemotaxis protein